MSVEVYAHVLSLFFMIGLLWGKLGSILDELRELKGRMK